MTNTEERLLSSLEQREVSGAQVDYKRFASPGAMLRWIEECGAVFLCEQMHASQGEKWSGLTEQPIRDIFATGKGDNALASFEAAQAKLTAPLVKGAALAPSVAGGAWVIPQMLAGNPLCARVKPKTRLPHKAFRFMLQVSAYTHQSELSEVGAKIARALWDYQRAGGTVSLTVCYVYGYSSHGKKRQTNSQACIFEVTIPLANDSAVALALSTAFYRPIGMGIASLALSPLHDDGIPMRLNINPNCQLLRGQREEDYPYLKKLGIA